MQQCSHLVTHFIRPVRQVDVVPQGTIQTPPERPLRFVFARLCRSTETRIARSGGNGPGSATCTPIATPRNDAAREVIPHPLKSARAFRASPRDPHSPASYGFWNSSKLSLGHGIWESAQSLSLGQRGKSPSAGGVSESLPVHESRASLRAARAGRLRADRLRPASRR